MMWFGDPGFNENFWPGFWGNLFADFLVGIVLVYVFSWLGKRTKRADLTIEMVTRFSKPRHRLLIFTISNNGDLNVAARDAYMTMFLDPALPGVYLKTLKTTPNVHASFGEPSKIWPDNVDPSLGVQCFLDGPIFPKSAQELVQVEVEVKPGHHYEVLWFISSIYGSFPKRSWREKFRIGWSRVRRRPLPDGTQLGRWNLDPKPVQGLEDS